jgi:hypothetical protein
MNLEGGTRGLLAYTTTDTVENYVKISVNILAKLRFKPGTY